MTEDTTVDTWPPGGCHGLANIFSDIVDCTSVVSNCNGSLKLDWLF